MNSIKEFQYNPIIITGRVQSISDKLEPVPSKTQRRPFYNVLLSLRKRNLLGKKMRITCVNTANLWSFEAAILA
jgi:hypothetical protein